MRPDAALPVATGVTVGIGCPPPVGPHDTGSKRRAQTLLERAASKKRAWSAARGRLSRELLVVVGHPAGAPGESDDVPGEARGDHAMDPLCQAKTPLDASCCVDPDGGLAMFPDIVPGARVPMVPMVPTHQCTLCGKTGTCCWMASKHIPRERERLRSVEMAGHECTVADRYLRFKIHDDLIPGCAQQFEVNRQAARDRRHQKEMADGVQTAADSRVPMPHTHQCGTCGWTGTCAWLAPDRPGSSVTMTVHRCVVTGRRARLHPWIDMIPGMSAQFELNRQAARERRAQLRADM